MGRATKQDAITTCVCGSEQFTSQSRDGYLGKEIVPIAVNHCDKCGVQHQIVDKSELDGYYTKVYHDRVFAHGYGQDKHVAKLRLKRYNLPSSTLLDVGSNNGAFVDACLESGIQACGVDPGAGCFKLDGDHTYGSELHSANFPSSFFDVVTCHDVIEHIADIRGFIREMRRVLKDFATMIVEVPDFDSLDGQHHWRIVEHLWFMNLKQFVNLFEEEGLVVYKVEFPIPGKIAFYLGKAPMKATKIMLPPGLGDIYWVMTKMEAFCKDRGIGIPDVFIQSHDFQDSSTCKRSEEYITRLPIVRYRGTNDIPKRHISKKKLHHGQHWILDDIHGMDHYIGFNGLISPRRGRDGWAPHSLEEIAPHLAVDYYPRMFVSLDEMRLEKQLRTEYPEGFIIAYFIGHGMYKRSWLKQFGISKIARTIEIMKQKTGKSIHLLGAEWDVRQKIHNAMASIPGVVDKTGQTTLPQVFAYLRAADGVVGFPSGLTIMSTVFKTPTVMLWSQRFKPGFWQNCCPRDAAENWYITMDVRKATPVGVCSNLQRVMEFGKS